jgi:hypothetical protein
MGTQNHHSPISGVPDVREAINTALGELDAGIGQIATGQQVVFGESVADATSSATATAVSGVYTARAIGGMEVDADNIVTLTSTQFTPRAGTYVLMANAYASGFSTGKHRLRLYNASQSVDVQRGVMSREYNATLLAVFTADGSDAYELQHYPPATGSPWSGNDGIGSGPNEVNMQVVMVRLGS